MFKHTVMNLNRLKSIFDAFTKKAQLLVKNKSETLNKVQEGITKASKNKVALQNIWQQVQLLFALAKDYANGSYTAVPRSSIIAIIAGLLYFISPIDLIPDFIVGIGLVDDVFVLSLVYKQVAKDLEKYQAWKDKQKTIISI